MLSLLVAHLSLLVLHESFEALLWMEVQCLDHAVEEPLLAVDLEVVGRLLVVHHALLLLLYRVLVLLYRSWMKILAKIEHCEANVKTNWLVAVAAGSEMGFVMCSPCGNLAPL
jgi:hypothetical protein